MENSIKTAQELKKALELSILPGCQKFEEDTGLKISSIGLINIGMRLNPGMTEEDYEKYKQGKDQKLIRIELTVEL